MHGPELLRTRLSAVVFLILLAAIAVGGVFSLPALSGKPWELEKHGLHAFMRGEIALEAEKQLEDKLSYQDAAIALWSSLRYALFHEGSKGVLVGKNEWLFTNEEFETPTDFETNLAANRQRIGEIAAVLKSKGILPVMLWIPAKARIMHSHLGSLRRPAAQEALSPPLAEGIEVVNGNPVLSGLSVPAFMRTDTHWSPEGARAMAQALARWLKSIHPEITLTPRSFINTAQNAKPYRGDLTKFIRTGIFQSLIGIEGETYTPYALSENAAPEDTGTDNSLFGEETIDVVLVGTSYSVQKEWHFEDFLKEVLQADVLNMADEGKGPFVPMEAFLKKLESGEITAPKLVVWEFPERYLPRPQDASASGKDNK